MSRCYWWDSPVCQSFFSPKGFVHTGRLWARSCAWGGWISLRSRQLGGSNAARREKSLTELSSLLLDNPQWPQGVCFMLEILEWKFLCKNLLHKKFYFIFIKWNLLFAWIPTENRSFISKLSLGELSLIGTSELFLKVTTITDIFAIHQSYVPVEVTSSWIGGK